MNVFSLSLGQDTGGQAFRLKRGFDRVSPTDGYRAMISSRTYADYPIDLLYDAELAQAYYSAADVVHLHNRLIAHRMFDQGDGRPVVLHHHGTFFREHHPALHKEAKKLRAVEVVSTIDLEMLQPGLTWLPAPYSMEWLRAVRSQFYEKDRPIRIAHAPTNRLGKRTDAILAVIAELQREHPRVKFDLIEQVTWAECLSRKAKADIYIDQLRDGYGNNAVEAWGMGIPVVAGVEDPSITARMRELWGTVPFVEATAETLYSVLRRLVTSVTARREGAQRGRAHAKRYHDESRVVPLLRQIYESAPSTTPARAGHQQAWRGRRQPLRPLLPEWVPITGGIA